MIYFFIFISKILENAISTLRMIVLANGRKIISAILNLIIALIWVISTTLVITNIQKDYFKIIVFALGSFIGSLIGSIMEEKIALGSNMLFVISEKEEKIIKELHKFDISNYIVNNNIIVIIVTRRLRKKLLKSIRSIDNNSAIISLNARKLVFK